MQSRWNLFLASKNIADNTLAKIPPEMQMQRIQQLAGLDELKGWASQKQRDKLTMLSSDKAKDKATAQEAFGDVVNTATASLKLNASSFSASFFTANAQKILDNKAGLHRLEALADKHGLQGTQAGQKIRSYIQKFEALYNGFECFLQNNGLELDGKSSFGEPNYDNMNEYRAAYKTQVAKNTDNLQRHYRDYCKALQGNA